MQQKQKHVVACVREKFIPAENAVQFFREQTEHAAAFIMPEGCRNRSEMVDVKNDDDIFPAGYQFIGVQLEFFNIPDFCDLVIICYFCQSFLLSFFQKPEIGRQSRQHQQKEGNQLVKIPLQEHAEGKVIGRLGDIGNHKPAAHVGAGAVNHFVKDIEKP